MPKSDVATDDLSRQSLYYLGSGAAWLTVLVGIIEISINFLPGGRVVPETVIDWFTLFQENWFIGLRNLGLLNIFATALSIPLYFAL